MISWSFHDLLPWPGEGKDRHISRLDPSSHQTFTLNKMPSLLKKLMNRATRPRTHPAQAEFDLLESPPPSPPTDIDRLAAQRLERLQTQGHTATLDHEQVRDFLSDPQAARPPAPAKLTKEGKSDKLRRFAVGDPPPRTRHVRSSDKGQKSLESLIGSISASR